MTLDRKSAHAALSSGTLVDRQDFEVLAHDIVDGLCDVIDAVAKQVAQQEVAKQRHARGLGIGSWEGNTGRAIPSNETETEKLQARQVKALETIAQALNRISARGES
jgi:hypothetical protein